MRYLSSEGCTLPEIVGEIGISRNWAWRLAHRHAIPLNAAQGRRKIVCALTPADRDALDEIATDAGVSRSEMLTRIARVVLEDGPRLRRQLGKLARPKRGYRPRGRA